MSENEHGDWSKVVLGDKKNQRPGCLGIIGTPYNPAHREKKLNQTGDASLQKEDVTPEKEKE